MDKENKWEGTNYQIWNKRGDVITNCKHTQRIIREYNKFYDNKFDNLKKWKTSLKDPNQQSLLKKKQVIWIALNLSNY